jgi:hypothetical protein
MVYFPEAGKNFGGGCRLPGVSRFSLGERDCVILGVKRPLSSIYSNFNDSVTLLKYIIKTKLDSKVSAYNSLALYY